MTAISSRERRSRPLLLSRYPPKIVQSVVCQLIFSWLHFPLSFLFPKTHLLSRIVQIHALLEQTHFSGLMSSPSTFSLNSLRERPPRIQILKESTRQEVVVWFYYSFSVLFGNWFFLFFSSLAIVFYLDGIDLVSVPILPILPIIILYQTCMNQVLQKLEE